jgi:hypothetical protein
MADPEENTRVEGVSPDGRPRRQPPIIDVKAVEVSLDGSGATTAGSGPGAGPSGATRSPKRILTLPSPMKFAIIGSACLIAGIIAGALWIFLAPDGLNGPQPNAASPGAAVPGDVAGRIAKPETMLKAPASQASPDKDLDKDLANRLASRLAALDAMLAPLSDRIAALERVVRDTAAAARVAGERADRMAGLFDEAKKSGDEQNSAQRHERSVLEGLDGRVKTLESRQTALQQQQERLDRVANAMTTPDKAVRVAIVAAALRSAVESDRPFTVELAATRSLGLGEGTLASLEPFATTGLPTRDELFRGLSALVPELRRVLTPPGRDLGYLDRLQASAVRMLNIRPVQDEPGDDPATVMSRIEFKLVQHNIDAMVAELDKLPAPARELAQSWRTKALARQDAVEAARLIATASLAKLGEPVAGGPSPQ